MPYFTSWDVNTFLCLVYWGLPDDVVKRMMVATKKIHEEFSLSEDLGYWTTNSPSLVRWSLTRMNRFEMKFQINSTLEFQYTRIHVFKRRLNLTKEFKQEWRLRSIEDRQKKVIEWCKFGSDPEERHQRRLMVRNLSDSYSNDYTKNLWRSWDAWSHCEHPPMIYHENTVRPQPWDRRVYISKWYEGIHPGRFFLFYKENKIIEERNGPSRRRPGGDGYVYPKIPIFDWGPYEQLIEDLKCIDGPGLGELSGSKVEHIDDLFLN